MPQLTAAPAPADPPEWWSTPDDRGQAIRFGLLPVSAKRTVRARSYELHQWGLPDTQCWSVAFTEKAA